MASEVALLITIGILIALVFVLLVVVLILRTSRIDARQCPRAAGEFGVQTQRNTTPLQICGVSRNQSCIFPAATLDAAIDQCNVLSDICSAFTYSAESLTMTIVDFTRSTPNGSDDLFIRQFPVIVS